MKRKIAWICIIAMAVLMGGCAKKPAMTQNGEAPTLTWYVAGNPQNDVGLINEAANKILEPAIGAKLDLRFIDYGAYAERMSMMLASKSDVDILQGSCFLDMANMVRRGAYLKLDDLLDKETPELKKSLPDFVWEGVKLDDGIYGVPNMQTLPLPNALAIRKDLAEKYHLDAEKIKKTTDIEPFLEQIKQNEPTLYPYRPTASNTMLNEHYTYHMFMDTEACIMDLKTNKVFPYYEMEGVYEAAVKAHEWYKKGYIRSDIATVGDDTGDKIAGRYAVAAETFKPGIEGELKARSGYDYICIQVGPSYITDVRATVTSIAQTSKNPEKALKLIEMVNTNKELFNIICYGLEGKHYNMQDNGHIEIVENSGYCPNTSWQFGNVFNSYPTVDQPDDVWEQTKKINEEAPRADVLGISFDLDSVRTELAQILKVQNEYLVAKINNGTDDPATYWDEYVNKLKAAGIEKLVQTKQEQVDAFLANKK